ncbi:hypothetical protein [Bacillus sp. T33-2]|uniref:hypothetical protein n=1 Tax=Bacillus sp. T33-2 TaxID=2054168 RepID=UPI0015E08959|nr:hypothetical protein [Bacillus sp. T33-2]
MAFFFGTVDFFEREILNHSAKSPLGISTEDKMYKKYKTLQRELLHDFVCDEKIRKDCLVNLDFAYRNLAGQDYLSGLNGPSFHKGSQCS